MVHYVSLSLAMVKDFMEESPQELQEDDTENPINFTEKNPDRDTIKGFARTTDFLSARQEDTRAFLAKSLVLIFAGSVCLSFGYIYLSTFYPTSLVCGLIEGKTICTSDSSGKDMITLVMSSLTDVIGTALGFYFGSRS